MFSYKSYSYEGLLGWPQDEVYSEVLALDQLQLGPQVTGSHGHDDVSKKLFEKPNPDDENEDESAQPSSNTW